MQNSQKTILFIFLLALIISFVIYKIPYKISISRKSPIAGKDEILDKLSLEQRIGQLFIIGFDGKVLNSEIENLIKEMHPGGILLLKRNIENENQLKELISSLQEIALKDTGLPLFVVVDQEGGLISRISWAEKTSQSEIESPERAYQIGKRRAEELKKLGINLNLAPLLDTTFPGDFIFERSFQKDAKIIGELAKELIRGQKEAGILTGLKHFPGYEGIPFNPEEKLAVLEKIPEISQFKKATAASDEPSEASLAPLGREALPEMIMTANVIYKDIDKELPFTFSKKGIQFLKKEILGDYLLVSDDLAQNSLLDKFSLKEIVTLPIKAGVDILIFSGWRMPPEKGVLAFREAVNKNEISQERINQSVSKIIELKQRLSE